MNYVCTFTDQKYFKNIINVWLPSLRRNFLGIPVVIAFNVNKADIHFLRSLDVIVIEHNYNTSTSQSVLGDMFLKRLELQYEFIKKIDKNDKVMLVDGSDVVFQTELYSFFSTVSNKIYYTEAKELSNKTTLSWFNVLFLCTNKDLNLEEKIKSSMIKSFGMIAGTKQSLLKYFHRHFDMIKKSKRLAFFGMNQIILTCLILKYPKEFELSTVHNFRLTEEDIIFKDGLYYKEEKLIPILHFSRPSSKPIYNKLFLRDIQI